MTDYEQLVGAASIYLDASAFPKIDIEEDAVSGLTRVLIYFSAIPVFYSWVGFGEFVGVARRKARKGDIDVDAYLFSCRALLAEIDHGKFHRIEPPTDRRAFLHAAQPLVAKYKRLGGGDVWHLLAASRLAVEHPPSTLLSFDRKLTRAAKAEGLSAVYGYRLDRDLLIQELKAKGKWIG